MAASSQNAVICSYCYVNTSAFALSATALAIVGNVRELVRPFVPVGWLKRLANCITSTGTASTTVLDGRGAKSVNRLQRA